MYWVLYSVLCTVRKSPLWVQHSDVSKLDFFCQKLSIFFSLDLFLTNLSIATIFVNWKHTPRYATFGGADHSFCTENPLYYMHKALEPLFFDFYSTKMVDFFFYETRGARKSIYAHFRGVWKISSHLRRRGAKVKKLPTSFQKIIFFYFFEIFLGLKSGDRNELNAGS